MRHQLPQYRVEGRFERINQDPVMYHMEKDFIWLQIMEAYNYGNGAECRNTLVLDRDH